MLKTFFGLFAIALCSALPLDGALAQTTQTSETATSPVPVQSVVLLSPSNSRISFVGIHVGDDPKPRLGGFQQFQGYAVVNPTSGKVESLLIDINVDSVWTQFEKLTAHLKNADFFETNKFPAARFASTKIETGADGQCKITGNLTLHGQTKEVSFPAKYQMSPKGLLLNSKFQLDRSQFGMNQMLSGVDKLVEVEIFVGQKTNPTQAQPGNGSEKKKQSKSESKSQLREVSVRLPNMT